MLVTCGLAHPREGKRRGLDTRLYLLFTMRAGKVARLETFAEEQEALEAAGLAGVVDSLALAASAGGRRRHDISDRHVELVGMTASAAIRPVRRRSFAIRLQTGCRTRVATPPAAA